MCSVVTFHPAPLAPALWAVSTTDPVHLWAGAQSKGTLQGGHGTRHPWERSMSEGRNGVTVRWDQGVHTKLAMVCVIGPA